MVQTPARNVTMSAMPSPFMWATRTLSGTGENWKPRSGWPSWSKSMKSWPVDGRYTPKSSGSPARAVPAINAAAKANTRKVLRELYVKEAAETLNGKSAGDDRGPEAGAYRQAGVIMPSAGRLGQVCSHKAARVKFL